MRRGVAILCLLLGVGVMAYPYIESYWVMPKKIEKAADGVVAGITPEQMEENRKELEQDETDRFDFSEVESLNGMNFTPTIDKKNVVGGIKIPSVGVDMPILYGATHKNMLVAAGTMKKSQRMGEGNYALAGHNARNPNILFAPIRRLQENDSIYITDKKRVYEYRVVGKEVVMPERVDVINDVEGKTLLTLVSCYSKDGSDRIIVTGQLKSIEDYR